MRKRGHQRKDGYVIHYQPDHPTADKTGRVYEHRAVFYDVNGPGPHNCHWCGRTLVWDDVTVDHLDEARPNNQPRNLVPSCSPCNAYRGAHRHKEKIRKMGRLFTFEGRTMSASEWAHCLGIEQASFIWRVNAGWPPDRLFKERKEDNGNRGPKSLVKASQKRRKIPNFVKQSVLSRQEHLCACGCGEELGAKQAINFDHSPALWVREQNRAGTDTVPPANDPDHIFAMTVTCHKRKTFHPRGLHTSLGSDIHAAAKTKRSGEKFKVVRKPRRTAFQRKHGKIIKSRWPKRKMSHSSVGLGGRG
jgi:hypothetical protein